jgi:hypothetical protein
MKTAKKGSVPSQTRSRRYHSVDDCFFVCSRFHVDAEASDGYRYQWRFHHPVFSHPLRDRLNAKKRL